MKKIDNQGSAIVTVLVVVLLISILATTILYLAATNFKMKKTEQHTKENFYECEVALEEIKADLLAMAADSAEDAYRDTLVKYASMTPDVRKSYYVSAFCDYYKKKWDVLYRPTDIGNPKDKVELVLASFFSDTGYTITVDAAPTAGITIDTSTGCVDLKGVMVSFTKDGYTSVITTDFRVTVPNINFDIETSTPSADEDARTAYDISNCVQYLNWVKK